MGANWFWKMLDMFLEMLFNLIYVGKLDDEGYHSHLGESKWKLTKGSLVLARRKKKILSTRQKQD